LFLNPRSNYSQRAIAWWLQKELIHGVLSAASEAVCTGLPVHCNSAGPAADPECLHAQKQNFLFIYTAISRDVLGWDPDPLVRKA